MLFVSMLLLATSVFPMSVCDIMADEVSAQRNHADWADRYGVCLEVVETSLKSDLDPFIAVSVAWEESRFYRDRVSSAGARGVMQIKRYWCPQKSFKDCELTASGINALKLLHTCKRIDWESLSCAKQRRHPRKWREALCHYNAGNTCYMPSRLYAGRIVNRANRMRNTFYGKD